MSTPWVRGAPIKKAIVVLFLLALAAFVYQRLIYAPRHQIAAESAYVLPRQLDVVDTYAEVRSVIATLHAGDRVGVLAHTEHWTEVQLPDGRAGWVDRTGLLDAEAYDRGEAALRALERFAPQAAGHTDDVANLHLGPSRDATVVMQLPGGQRLDIYRRRLAARPPSPAGAPTPKLDAWYLVRAGERSGWVLGRLVDLDPPAGIAAYAEDVNMVAWLTLRTVNDAGKPVPEYLAADRIGLTRCDFNHIRVFTWWIKHHKYVTAYVEGNLTGYFPIRTRQTLNADYFNKPSPYFWLRLMDDEGHKFQKVYGMFDTIVRPLGTVDGWTSNAIPPKERKKHRPLRKRRRR